MHMWISSTHQQVKVRLAVLRVVVGVWPDQACEEWFHRMRPLQLRLAAAAGHNGAVVLHAMQLLPALQRQAAALLAPPPPPLVAKPTAAPAPDAAPADATANAPAVAGQTEWPSLPGHAAQHVPAGTRGKGRAKRGKDKGPGRPRAMPVDNPSSDAPPAAILQPKILRRATPPPTDAISAVQHPVTGARLDPGMAVGNGSATSGVGGGERQPVSAAEKLARDVLSVLQHACAALVSWGEPDAVAGLHAHAHTAFGPLLSSIGASPAELLAWMEGARLEAAGDCEAAARTYSASLAALQVLKIPLAAGQGTFLQERAAAAYAATADWDGLSCVSMRPQSPAVQRMRALASLDNPLEDAHSLSQWDADPAAGFSGSSHTAPAAGASLMSSFRLLPSAVSSLRALSRASELINSQHSAATLPALTSSSSMSSLHAQSKAERGARAGRRGRQPGRGGGSTPESKIDSVAEPDQDGALIGALAEVTADQDRLVTALSVSCGEGTSALAPLWPASWLLGLHAARLQERLNRDPAADSASPSPVMLGLWGGRSAVLEPMSGTPAQGVRLGTGAREADVGPWVQAEMLMRIGRAPVGETVLLDIAAGARRTGNWGLAERLLRQVSAAAPVDRQLAEVAGGRETMLRQHMERLRLAITRGAAGGASGASAHAAQELWHSLQACSGGSTLLSPAAAVAEALLLLAQWQGSSAAPAVAQRSRSSIDASVQSAPSAGEPHATPVGLPSPETCLEAAVASAPASTALAARAWAAYADWLFEAGALSAQPTAAQEGGGALADAAPDDAAVAGGSGFAVRAVQAYCASLSQAGQGSSLPGAGEDHALTLLRILQVSSKIAAAQCRTCRTLPQCSADLGACAADVLQHLACRCQEQYDSLSLQRIEP